MTLRQLINQRLVHRIPQSAIAERMGCTHQWVSIIEGFATGANASNWADRYAVALTQLIEEQKSK